MADEHGGKGPDPEGWTDIGGKGKPNPWTPPTTTFPPMAPMSEQQYAAFLETQRQAEQVRQNDYARQMSLLTTGLAALAQAQTQSLAAGAGVQPPQQHPPANPRPPLPKLAPPEVPSPASDFKAWNRGVDEWLQSFAAYSDFDKARNIKMSLPENLRAHADETITIVQMGSPDGVKLIRELVEARYKPERLDEEAETLAAFDKFQRASPDFRAYCDQFIVHIDALNRHGVKYDDKHKMLLLMHKAKLSDAQQRSIRSQMKTIALGANRDSTYDDARELLVAMSADKSTVTVAYTQDQYRYGNDAYYYYENYSGINNDNDRQYIGNENGINRHAHEHNLPHPHSHHHPSRGRSRSPSVRYNSDRSRSRGRKGDKGKGKGKGWRPPCRDGSRCQDRNCHRFHPRTYPGGRSRSPKGKGKGKRSPSGGRAPCRDFLRNKCTRGDNCRFSHDNVSQRSSSHPRSPSFGRSRGHPSRSPSGRR